MEKNLCYQVPLGDEELETNLFIPVLEMITKGILGTKLLRKRQKDFFIFLLSFLLSFLAFSLLAPFFLPFFLSFLIYCYCSTL